MQNSGFKKHGDKLLFVLALAVLAVSLFRVIQNRVIPEVLTSIVFVQWWEDDLRENSLLDLIEEFESFHDGIKIVLSFKSYEDLKRSLFDSAENGFTGDIIALDPLWVPELKNRKIIESANLPLLSFISVLYYNIDILKEAGFSRPPKSRSEFLACARAISGREDNRWGLVMDETGSRQIYNDVYPWFWAAGLQLLGDGRPTVNSRQFIEGLSFLSSLNSEGLILHGSKLEDFGSGKAAFMISSTKDITYIRERLGETSFDISNVPFPDNFAGKTYYGDFQWAVAISSNSAHKEEAALFADFLAGKASILSEKAEAMPGGSISSRDPFYLKAWDIAIAAEPAREFAGLPWAELEKIFREERDLLFAGESAPAETAAAVQRRWTERLEL
jgi:multiple sugar transport system substrate-binding protein